MERWLRLTSRPYSADGEERLGRISMPLPRAFLRCSASVVSTASLARIAVHSRGVVVAWL